MTIHEFAQFIPLGAKIALYAQDPDAFSFTKEKIAEGIATSYNYSDNFSDQSVCLRIGNDIQSFNPQGIAHAEILALPATYGKNASGASIPEIAEVLYSRINEHFTMSKFKDFRFTLQSDFAATIMPAVDTLNKMGLETAAAQVQSLAQSGQAGKLPAYSAFPMFDQLQHAREQAQKQDLFWLRRAEALLSIRHHKSHPNCEPIRHAINLITANLVEGKASLLPPEAYGQQLNDQEQALDWFLLGMAYHSAHMQNGCAYAAIVQSILHRGQFFSNKTNQSLFVWLCGGSHDFTFVSQLLSRYRMENGSPAEREEYPKTSLITLGRLVCWMLYQLGGQAILDSTELIGLVEARDHTSEQLATLHELLLAFTLKYSPRNRNDRYLAITTSMKAILERIQSGEIPLVTDFGQQFGYIYEFHGDRGVVVQEMSGQIMGSDLIPYRFSYSAQDNQTIPSQLQNLLMDARDAGSRLLIAATFCAEASHIKDRPMATDLTLITGGHITL